MIRKPVALCVDSDGNMFSLANDGTMWTYGTRGWDKVADLPQPDGEESLADIAIGAELKRAMGEPLDALEESLLP